MVNNLTHKDIYAQLKGILDGCDTILDAIPFCNNYSNKYPHMKEFIYSYVNGKRYNDTVDIKTKQSIIYDIYMADTKNNALNISSVALKRTTDTVYKNTLDRLSNTKEYKILQKPKKQKNIDHIQKKCPHKKCGHIASMPKDTQYIICGYTDPIHGYDWNGCGRDWCFECEKILCKSWEINKLHNTLNRNHNSECCKKHALLNSYKYPDNYCQCNNLNIYKNIDNFLDLLDGCV